jgi:hypothetical protein
MMASKVGMCNAALTKIGGNAILSLTEATEEGRQCNSRFDETLDFLLQSHPWNFAIHRATLVPITTAPDHEWEYQFLLPTNPYCLKLLFVYLDHPHKVEGRYILCDSNAISITYIKRIADVNQLSPIFRELFAMKLAAELAYPIAGSTTKGESLLAEFKQGLRAARSIDAQEGTPDNFRNGSWMTERGKKSNRFVVAREY